MMFTVKLNTVCYSTDIQIFVEDNKIDNLFFVSENSDLKLFSCWFIKLTYPKKFHATWNELEGKVKIITNMSTKVCRMDQTHACLF